MAISSFVGVWSQSFSSRGTLARPIPLPSTCSRTEETPRAVSRLLASARCDGCVNCCIIRNDARRSSYSPARIYPISAEEDEERFDRTLSGAQQCGRRGTHQPPRSEGKPVLEIRTVRRTATPPHPRIPGEVPRVHPDESVAIRSIGRD